MPETLIAFVGFKNSGKNTAADALAPLGFRTISFADALKDMLAAMFCWDRGLLEGITPESRAWREEVDHWWAGCLGIPEFTPRWAMMNVGTEVIRKHFHHEMWVLNVERRLMLVPDQARIVLPDVRFSNEVAMARRHGAQVIRIQRGPEPEWYSLALTANTHPEPIMRDYLKQKLQAEGVHSSEYAWIGSPIDMTISNDGTIADLHDQVLRAASVADPSR